MFVWLLLKLEVLFVFFMYLCFFSRREVLNFNFIFIFCLLSSNIFNVQKKQKEDITCLRIWAICMIDCPFFLGYILLRIFFRLWAPRLRQKYVYKKEKQKNVPHLEKLDKSRHDQSKPLVPRSSFSNFKQIQCQTFQYASNLRLNTLCTLGNQALETCIHTLLARYSSEIKSKLTGLSVIIFYCIFWEYRL